MGTSFTHGYGRHVTRRTPRFFKGLQLRPSDPGDIETNREIQTGDQSLRPGDSCTMWFVLLPILLLTRSVAVPLGVTIGKKEKKRNRVVKTIVSGKMKGGG